MDDSQASGLLSKRGFHFFDNPNMISQMSSEITEDLFDPHANPTGIVNMGVAENTLCGDLLTDRLKAPDMNVVTAEMLRYFDFTGTAGFRQSLCDFMTRYFKPANRLDPQNVIVLSGMGTALDMLANLLSDPGDCFLTPVPCYAGLFSDFRGRAQSELLPVHFSHDSLEENMKQELVTDIIKAFDEVYASARKKGRVIKGIVLVNPHNPTGQVMPLKLISAILDFAKRYDLHAIYDAAYTLSTFDSEAPVSNILQLSNLPDREKTYLVWGFSKDLNMSGMRCALIYTENKPLLTCAKQYNYFSAVPPIVQYKLQRIISDYEWFDKFLKTNTSRIRKAYTFCAEKLRELGIPFQNPKAAFFIWADFTQFLSDKTEEGERELLKKMIMNKVFFLPGFVQGCQDPGWFRITFVQPMEYLEQGFSNLARFVAAEKKK